MALRQETLAEYQARLRREAAQRSRDRYGPAGELVQRQCPSGCGKSYQVPRRDLERRGGVCPYCLGPDAPEAA